MEVVISSSQILALCGGIITVNGAIAVLINVISKAQAPQKLQEARITKLEEKVRKHDELLANDLVRLETIEGGNRIILKSLLALLKHGIDGNNISALEEAERDLTNYLVR